MCLCVKVVLKISIYLCHTVSSYISVNCIHKKSMCSTYKVLCVHFLLYFGNYQGNKLMYITFVTSFQIYLKVTLYIYRSFMENVYMYINRKCIEDIYIDLFNSIFASWFVQNMCSFFNPSKWRFFIVESLSFLCNYKHFDSI